MKKFIKSLLPPVIIAAYLRRKRRYGYFGMYTTWQEARKNSSGYDSRIIIDKVQGAALKVRQGKALYERDSVVRDEIQHSWHLLASLLWIASQNDNRLNILDFGGALGTSYFQNRNFLNHLKEFTWSIVEQKQFVDHGKESFEDDHLKFYYSIQECLKEQRPTVILLSSVLQYLEHPYETLTEVSRHPFMYVIFDKTPMHNGPEDIITVQKVPKHIYDASYPSWVFSTEKFLSHFQKNYVRLASFNQYAKDIFSLPNLHVEFAGYLFKKTDSYENV